MEPCLSKESLNTRVFNQMDRFLPGINFSRDSSRDNLQDLFAEQDKQFVNGQSTDLFLGLAGCLLFGIVNGFFDQRLVSVDFASGQNQGRIGGRISGMEFLNIKNL